jgi:hypothetical protein
MMAAAIKGRLSMVYLLCSNTPVVFANVGARGSVR